MPAQTVIKLRRDSAADWASVNPVLADGEVGLESDSGLVKYGNGTSQWSDLPYTTAASVKTKVQNNTGSSIPKGSVVYISGASGDNPRITLADADTEATSSKTLGITEAAIADGAQGYVIESGLITGLNTAAATAGQSVWLSSTAGQFVFNAPPAKPAHSVYLGVVIRAHANQGAILVKVQNGYELNELHDVNAGSPSTNDVLQWNGTAWVNADVISQATSAVQPQLDAKASLSGATFTGDVTIETDLIVDGDLTVSGTTTTVSAQDLVVSDPLIYIGEGNTTNLVDLGIVSSFNDGTYQHSGIVRDASANKWKLFKGVTDEPTTTVNFAQGSLDDLAVGAIEASSATIGDVSNTELQYLNGVTSAIQTQLDGKASTSHSHTLSNITDVTATATQVNYLGGAFPVTSSVQTQLDGKAALSHGHNASAITYTIEDKSANYTIVATDEGKVIRSTGSAITVTVADVFSIGEVVTFTQYGAGQVTFTPAGGVTLHSVDSKRKTNKQYSTVQLMKTAAATYLLFGDIAA